MNLSFLIFNNKGTMKEKIKTQLYKIDNTYFLSQLPLSTILFNSLFLIFMLITIQLVRYFLIIPVFLSNISPNGNLFGHFLLYNFTLGQLICIIGIFYFFITKDIIVDFSTGEIYFKRKMILFYFQTTIRSITSYPTLKIQKDLNYYSYFLIEKNLNTSELLLKLRISDSEIESVKINSSANLLNLFITDYLSYFSESQLQVLANSKIENRVEEVDLIPANNRKIFIVVFLWLFLFCLCFLMHFDFWLWY